MSSISKEISSLELHMTLKNLLRMDDLPPCLWVFQDGQCLEQAKVPGIEHHRDQDSLYFKLIAEQLTSPFFLVHLSHQAEPAVENQIRTLLTVEQGSATFVEIYLHVKDFASCNIASTEITLSENATLHHIQIQHGNQKGSQTLNTEIKQAANSHYQGSMFAFNLCIQKIAVLLGLHHNHAKANLSALMFLRAKETACFNLTVLHKEPLCESNTLIRGVVDDQAKGEFSGKIIIEENASRSEAKLENKNMLLSQHAEMTTRPQLEVFNDDVQCTHGATVGHLDLQALFYLTSRGIPLDVAKKMLMESFARPTFVGLPDFLLSYIEARIHER